MRGLKQSASCVALSIALGWAATAAAQETPGVPLPGTGSAASDTNVATTDEVVVTGSRVARPNITSAAPIESVTSQEISQEGAISVSDIINQLPQVSPDNQRYALDSNGSQNIINLHSVGTNRTLALIDGQRIATAEGVNVNAIPVALIDRIDVLTGGTSGVYGADALAGVVNFVLKKDFDGLTVSAGTGIYEHDNDGNNIGAQAAKQEGYNVPHGVIFDGASGTFNIAAGHHFFDNKLSIETYFNYTKQDPVLVSDRDYSSCYLTQNGTVNTAPVCQVTSIGGVNAPYGTFAPQAGPNSGTVFANAKNGSQTFVPQDDTFIERTNTQRNILNQNQSDDGGLFINYKILPNLNFYIDYMISSSTEVNHSESRQLYNSGDYGSPQANYILNCNNPLMSTQQQQTLCGAPAAGTTATVPVKIYYQFAGGEDQEYDNLDQRVATGFKGSFINGLFKYDLNYIYSTFSNRQLGNVIENNNLNATTLDYALNGCVGAPAGSGCAPLNIFSANQTPSSAAIKYIYGSSRGTATNSGSLYNDTVNLTTDLGKIGVKSPFAKDGVAVNVGGEFRVDREVNDCNDPLNEIGCGDFSRSENVKEGYAELSLPLIQDALYTHLLSFDAAFRGSEYSLSSNLFKTFDLQAVYAPIKDITFRGTYSRAAREPTVYEFGSGVISYVGGASDPCAGAVNPTAAQTAAGIGKVQYSLQECEAMGVTAAQYGNVPQCDKDSCLARSTVSHPDPETGYTYTIGFVAQPRFIPRLTVSVDYFNITVDKIISTSYDSTWEQGCAQYQVAYYCDHIVRNSDGSLTSADVYKTGTTPTTGFVTYGTYNGYRYYNRGFDLQAQYVLPVDQIKGSLTFNLNGEYDSYHGGSGGPGQAVNQSSGYFGTYAGIPRPNWTQTLRTTYTTQDKFWSISANWRYIGGTSVTNDSGNPALFAGPGENPYLTIFNKISPFNYLDLSTSFFIQHRYTVTLVCNNVFDKNPPLFPDAYNQNQSIDNTIPQTYDPLGRSFRVNVSASF